MRIQHSIGAHLWITSGDFNFHQMNSSNKNVKSNQFKSIKWAKTTGFIFFIVSGFFTFSIHWIPLEYYETLVLNKNGTHWGIQHWFVNLFWMVVATSDRETNSIKSLRKYFEFKLYEKGINTNQKSQIMHWISLNHCTILFLDWTKNREKWLTLSIT